MHVGVIGVNHKSSCLTLREKLAGGCTQLDIPFSAAVLSTCNRFEIYFSSEVLADGHVMLMNLLREEIDLAFEHHLYSFFGVDCFAHLVRVTAGLDSAVIGETEIQSQVKKMYQRDKEGLNTPMHFMMQKSLKLAKQLRNAALYPRSGISLERLIFEKLADDRVLFIGNSEINRRIWAYLRRRGKEVHVASRYPVEGIKQVNFSEWPKYGSIVLATKAEEHMIEVLPDQRRRQFFDLSIPRTVAPSLGKEPGVSLYNIDQLGQEVQKAQHELDDCAELVERLVSRQQELYWKGRLVAGATR